MLARVCVTPFWSASEKPGIVAFTSGPVLMAPTAISASSRAATYLTISFLYTRNQYTRACGFYSRIDTFLLTECGQAISLHHVTQLPATSDSFRKSCWRD